MFSFSACIFAVAGIGCFIGFVEMYSSSRRQRKLARAAGALGAIACLGLIGVAATPGDRYPLLHGQFSLLASGAFLGGNLIFAIATTLDARFPRIVPLGWSLVTAVLLGWIWVSHRVSSTDLGQCIAIAYQKIVAVVVVMNFFFQIYQADRVARRGNGWSCPR